MSKTRQKYLDRIKYLNNTKDIAHFYHFDNWDQNEFFYARVNKKGRIVAPLDRTTLKQIPGSNLLALDFVVDAFRDMDQQYAFQVADNNLEPILGARRLVAKRAYANPVSLYQEHLVFMQEMFFKKYLNPHRDKIKFFDDIVFYFMRFAEEMSRDQPILFSYFVKSSKCPIHATGLVLETAAESHNKDEMKYRILNSKDFNFYTKMAARFGFIIPRHAPWTFVANLDSTIMFDYIRQYDVSTKEQIMSEYFYECQGFDVDMLRKFLYDAYALFAKNNAVRRVTKICENSGKLKTKTRNVLRPSLSNVINQYNSRQWLHIYMRVLMLENRIKVSKKAFDLFFKDCYYIFDKQGFEAAIDFAEMKLLNKRKDILV